KSGRFGDVVDERYFSPEQDAVLVGELVSVIGVLVMSEAQRGGAQLFEHRKIREPLGIPDGPSVIEPILVHVEAVQIQVMAIEKKAVGRIHAERAKAQRLGDDVHRTTAVPHLNKDLV